VNWTDRISRIKEHGRKPKKEVDDIYEAAIDFQARRIKLNSGSKTADPGAKVTRKEFWATLSQAEREFFRELNENFNTEFTEGWITTRVK
jgi:hypothetical protein